jgi:hypothetical protein
MREITAIRRSDPPGFSTCRKCCIRKSDGDYYPSRLGRNGLSPYCKSCHNIDVKTYQRGRPRAKKLAIQRRCNLKRYYGLSADQYQALWDKQQGLCAVCGKPEDAEKGATGTLVRLAVDHNHDTNKVRALLCNRCNRAIGFFQDDAVLLQKAVDYLQSFEQHAT